MKNLFVKTLSVLALALTMTISSASATSTSVWELAPNFGDGDLPAGFNVYGLTVTSDTDWLLGELDVQLTGGTLNHIAPMGIGGGPRPILQNFNDSGVFNPATPNDATSLGANLSGSGLAASDQPMFVETDTSLTVGWFNTRNTDIGTFQIAALTLSDDANGTISGRVITNAEGNEVSEEALSFDIVNGVIDGDVDPTMAVPSLADMTPIDLSDAFRNSDGIADNALSFTNSGGGDLEITDARIETGTEDPEGVFAAARDGLNVDLSINLSRAFEFPAGTAATATLIVETNGGNFSYPLSATIPEPATLSLVGLAMIGLIGLHRRS